MNGVVKILFLEDDADLQWTVKEILTISGYEVYGAVSAKEALQLFENGLRPQLILMDLTLPCTDPAQFMDEMHARFPQIKAPLIVASGRGDLQEWAIRLGAKTTLRKPYDLETLCITVEAVLETSMNAGSGPGLTLNGGVSDVRFRESSEPA